MIEKISKKDADWVVDSTARWCKRCKYSVNNIIKSFPYNGKTRYVRCPKCGQRFSFTAPIFLVE